jgi:hypothetical protein
MVMRLSPHPAPPASPVELERRRLEEAERLMTEFCVDLNELVGRKMPDRDGDELTRRIYAAAHEAGVALEDDTSWMIAAGPMLNKMRGQVDAAIYARICAAWTGELPNLGDVARALEFAKGYFEVGEPDPDLILDLATCLLDYAFCAPREQPSRALVFEQTATDDGFALAVRQEMVALEQRKEHVVAVRENRSLHQLSTSLRLAGTVGLVSAWIMTGQVVFIPLIAVLWLMSWMLVSRKLLEVPSEPEPAELLERALDELGSSSLEPEDPREAGKTGRVTARLGGLGPVWPFVAPTGVRLEGAECRYCSGVGELVGTFKGQPVCSVCADAIGPREAART